MVKNNFEGLSWAKLKTLSARKKVILFGASRKCKEVMEKHLTKYHVIVRYICDNDKNKHGTYFNGVPVEPPSKLLQEDRKSIIVICTSSYFAEIVEQLNKANIYCYSVNEISINSSIHHIKKVRSLLSDVESIRVFDSIIEKRKKYIDDYSDICVGNQYFLSELYDIGTEEIFVDCGAFNGDSIHGFLKLTNGKFKEIHAFEPSPSNFKLLSKACNQQQNIKLYNKGVYDSNSVLHFQEFSENMAGSRVNGKGTNSIKVVKIDDVIKGQVTFIKMDVEGCELKALQGAKKTIATNKPKLAICLYHKFEDLWQIPLWVNRINPAYKMYIRHHYNNIWETVLYATIS